MRTLWNVVSFLAVVHLLGLVIVMAWLWQSGRLDGDRALQVKELFALTIPEAQAVAAKAQAEAEAEALRQAQEQLKANPPASSATQIQLLTLVKQQEEQSRRRLDDEKRMLLQVLADATARVDAKHAEIEQERKNWENAIAAERQRKTDEQFMQTVRQYEQVTAVQAKKMLTELINQGNTAQAVAYLDAMNPRAASKILREFKTDPDIALATDLLEKLRTFGLDIDNEPGGTQETSNAKGLASAD